MRLLVAGGDRVDAGKTTFSVGLIERTDALGVKPRAGNDYWFDHDDYERAVAEGRLYGKDAKRFAAATAADVTPEEINPVHRLWRPSPGPDAGLVGQARRSFVADRVRVDGEDRYVVNAAADVPDSARRHLPLSTGRRVETLADLNDLTREWHLPALASLRDRVAAADRAVVESYADIARPLREFVPDAVAVVEPQRVRVYDGERYDRACEVAGGSARDGRLEERVEDVVSRLEPAASLALPALSGEERSEPAAVADAYEVAYDGLLAAAVE